MFGYELDCEEGWTQKNWCFWTVVLEKTLESPLDCKEIQPVLSIGDQSWVFFGRTDAEVETPILWPLHAKSWLIWKRLWCWEGLGAGGEGDDRGWDGWMASPTQWMLVWVNSGSWWWTGRPGVLQFMGSQRAGHDWETELNWTELNWICSLANVQGVNPTMTDFWLSAVLQLAHNTLSFWASYHWFLGASLSWPQHTISSRH